MLKYFILAFGFFVTVQATYCTSQEECYDHECCVHIILGKGNCRRRPKGGNNCDRLAGMYNKGNKGSEMYKINCMCPEGYECQLGKELLDKVPRCRKSETTTKILQTTTDTIVTETEISPTEIIEPTEQPDKEIENPEEPDTEIDKEIENPEELDKEPDTDIENEIVNPEEPNEEPESVTEKEVENLEI